MYILISTYEYCIPGFTAYTSPSTPLYPVSRPRSGHATTVLKTAKQAEERLSKASAEAAEFQAAAAAARAAGRDAMDKAGVAARQAAAMRDEVSRLKSELETSRAACALKVICCCCYRQSLLLFVEVVFLIEFFPCLALSILMYVVP